MKSFTDVSQSKKLAEVLPLESADMEYMFLKKDGSKVSTVPFVKDGFEEPECCYSFIPCWSLAALLSVLPKTINFGYENDSTFVLKPLENGNYLADFYEVAYVKDNPIDACYEMIIKLHEQKLL